MDRILYVLLACLAVVATVGLGEGIAPSREQHVAHRGIPAEGDAPAAQSSAPVLFVRGVAPASGAPNDLSDPWIQKSAGTRVDPDPWMDTVQQAEPPRPVSATTRRLSRWVFRTHSARTEAMALDLGSRHGLRLVTYDLSALIPETVYPLEPLQGVPPAPGSTTASGFLGMRPIATSAGWLERLAREVFDGVGASRWDEVRHLLAWDAHLGHLLLRQDQAALKRVEAVLDRWAVRAEQVVPLRAAFLGKGSQALQLDVPRGRAVRACRGLACAYVGDFDVEVHMRTFVTDPILMRLETGVGVAAVRLDSKTTAADQLHVALARAHGPPTFTPDGYLCTLADVTVRIDIPATTYDVWRGTLPAAPGVHVVQLGDGTRCRLTVGAPRAAVGQHPRAWRRVRVRDEDNGPLLPETHFHVRLDGARRGLVGVQRLTVCEEGSTVLRPAAGTTARADARRAGLSIEEDPPLHGAIRLTARSVGAPDAPSALDLVLEAGRTRVKTRSAAVRYEADDGKPANATLKLPSAHLERTSMRVFLSPEGWTRVTFRADLGRGTESCALELRRIRAP